MDKPDPGEAPEPVKRGLVRDLQNALRQRHRQALGGDPLRVEAQTGPSAAWLKCVIGPESRAHEIELFIRDTDEPGIEGGLGLLVDFLDGALEQFFAAERDAWLPLDFTGYPFEDHVILARMELRDLAAERAADELLEQS